jgi:ABC-type nitrate/sulfonate/bicarbonate transport system substrate-binding protein
VSIMGWGLTRSDRRKLSLRLLSGIVVILLATIAAACGEDEPAQTEASTAAGTDVPQSTVRFGFYPCCADHALFHVAIQKGFFEDVGITLDPPEGHQYTLFDQITPSMQRGDFDVAATFIQGYLQTLATFGQDIPPILFHDIYVGYAILKSPDSTAKTAQDFMDEGMSFPEAAAAAVEQLEGEPVYTPPHGQVQPPYPDVFMSYADMEYPKDLDLQFLEDTKIVELSAKPGRVEFAIPYAAPVLVQMIRNGYEPVINVNMIFENDQGSAQAERMTELVGSSGLMAQREWVEQERDTAIRFLSAVYRVLDFLEDPATREEGWKIEADIINATQGLDLIPEDIGVIFEEIDPLFPWKEQGPQLWEDEDAQFHVRSSLDTQIQALIEDGTLPQREYDIDQFLVAEDLYNEMKSLQEEADQLLQEAEDADLSGEQADLVEQARQYYEWHDYLDAVRLLNSALES